MAGVQPEKTRRAPVTSLKFPARPPSSTCSSFRNPHARPTPATLFPSAIPVPSTPNATPSAPLPPAAHATATKLHAVAATLPQPPCPGPGRRADAPPGRERRGAQPGGVRGAGEEAGVGRGDQFGEAGLGAGFGAGRTAHANSPWIYQRGSAFSS